MFKITNGIPDSKTNTGVSMSAQGL